MGKKLKGTNGRVEIKPILKDNELVFEKETLEILILNLADLIREDYILSIKDYDFSIEYDYEEVCEFCGKEWMIDIDGCPHCCALAIEEWEHNNN